MVMGKRVLLGLLLLTIITTSCQKVEALMEATFKSQDLLNISYGADPNNIMDVYLPAGRGDNTEIVFLIHGGSWTSGDKSEFTEHAINLRRMGYAVVNLNYRLVTGSGSIKLADQINDIRQAVNFAYSKSVDWEVSNKIGLVGASAGAHLALLYTYAYNADDKVKTVVSLAGPVNFNDARNVSAQLASVVESLVGARLSSNPEAFKALSPIAKVTASSKPTLIFHGRKDTTVPIQQSIDLKAKLDEANVKNKLVIYENAGHEVVNTDNMASFMADLSSWLNANIK